MGRSAMAGAVAAVVLGSGCSLGLDLSGLTGGAPGDGGGDAAVGCGEPASFCDDFEDGGLGAAWSARLLSRGTLAFDPGFASARAVRAEVTSGTGTGTAYLAYDFPDVRRRFRCEADVFIASKLMTASKVPVLQLSESNASGSSYRAHYFSYSEGSWRLDEYVVFADGGTASQRSFATQAPPLDTWFHVAMETDGASATLSFGGETITLAKITEFRGTRQSVLVGLLFTSATSGFTRFDNVKCSRKS